MLIKGSGLQPHSSADHDDLTIAPSSTSVARGPDPRTAARPSASGLAAATASGASEVGTRPSVSVVIPTLNEERNIARVLQGLPECVDETILVDGRSTDRTIEVARSVRPDIRVVLERQPGRGAALHAGFAAATGDCIVIIDPGVSTDPTTILHFVDALRGCETTVGRRSASARTVQPYFPDEKAS